MLLRKNVNNDVSKDSPVENRMNASTFRDIRARVMFLKFSKLHEPHASAIWEPKKHHEWPYRTIYNIFNKILRQFILGMYFSVNHWKLFIEIFVLVLLHFSVEFSFIYPFFPDIQPPLFWIIRVFVCCIYRIFSNRSRPSLVAASEEGLNGVVAFTVIG